MADIPLGIHGARICLGASGATDEFHIRQAGQGFKLIQGDQRADRMKLGKAVDNCPARLLDLRQQTLGNVGLDIHQDPAIRRELDVRLELRHPRSDDLVAIQLQLEDELRIQFSVQGRAGGLFLL